MSKSVISSIVSPLAAPRPAGLRFPMTNPPDRPVLGAATDASLRLGTRARRPDEDLEPASTPASDDPALGEATAPPDAAEGIDAAPEPSTDADPAAPSQGTDDEADERALIWMPMLGGAGVGLLSLMGSGGGHTRPPAAIQPPTPAKPEEGAGGADNEHAPPPEPEPPLPSEPSETPNPPEPSEPPQTPETPELPEQPPRPPSDIEPPPPPNPPTLRLRHDTGRADDRITSDATVDVLDLLPEARWDYSLDGGLTWTPGEGTSLSADLFATDGAHAVLVRQADASGRLSTSASLTFELDTLADAPTLRLQNDTGASASDFISRDGTLVIGGLEVDAQWEYSLDGIHFLPGSGVTLEAERLPTRGSIDVYVRQTDVAGNLSDARHITLHLHDRAADLDLSERAGTQQTTWWLSDFAQLRDGIALTNTTAPLTSSDIHRLTIQVGGPSLDLVNDRLWLGTELSLQRDAGADQVTLAGVTGLSYRYDAATQRLTLWRTNDSDLSGSEAAALTNALRLRNHDAAPVIGDRTFRLSYEDMAGNTSNTAVVTVTVDPRLPSLDLNGAAFGIHAEQTSSDLLQGVAPFASDLTVGHQNPDATVQRVRIGLTGGGASRDDLLVSRDQGVDTVLAGTSARFTVDGKTWAMTRFSDTYSLSLADGSNASLAETQAMLASLREQNLLATPLQGSRTFTVTLLDHYGRAASASGTITYDTVAPQADMNGSAAGVDQDVVVTPGLPWAFSLADPATGAIVETHGVMQLTLRFSTSIADAFNTTTPNAGEWIGLFDPDRGDDRSVMLRLGEAGTLTLNTLVPRRVLTLNLSGGDAPVLTITADAALTQAQASAVLRALYYTAESDVTLGLRTVEVTATDRAGNVGAQGAVTRLDVRETATPVLYLASEADTGLHHNDRVTARNGSGTSPLVLAGFAPAGQTVTVFNDANRNGLPDGGELLGSAIADANGQWRLTLSDRTLADGDYQLFVQAGGLSSGMLTMTVDTRPPASTVVMRDKVHVQPSLTGIVDPGRAVLVEIDTDNNLGNGYELRYLVDADEAGHWHLDTATATSIDGQSPMFSAGDIVNVRVTTEDLAGNQTIRTASATVETTTYAISDSQVIEGTDGTREMVFLVSRSGDLSTAGSVRFAVDEAASSARSVTEGAAADDDFVGAMSGLLSFAPGEETKVIKFTVKGDHYREVNDTLVVRLDEPVGGVIQDGLGLGAIQEIDISLLQAAYGLRKLNPRSNDFAIRVRRSSDDAEQDIGFDASGQLDRQALLDFVGTGATAKGFVTRWYDQSGHGRDMTQIEQGRQGVIVDNGELVTRADGSPAISFNNRRNGTNDDFMQAAGLAADDWQTALMYVKAQSEYTNQYGGLFNLGGSAGKYRLSSYYPGERGYTFDINGWDSVRRLTVAKPISEIVGVANDMVFEAHAGVTSAGTAELNYTDSAQAIYEQGVRVASDDTMPDSFSTSNVWLLGWQGLFDHTDGPQWDGRDSRYYAQGMYTEFLVYLAKDNSTPEIRWLQGSAKNDVLTYAGEPQVQAIDGLAGHDTLYISGSHDVDFAAFSGGVRNIEQVWMANGARNTLTLSAQTVALNGADSLTVRMDEGDALILDLWRFEHSALTQNVVIGNAGDNIIRATGDNDVLIGGAGADTFVWGDGYRGRDLVWDYTTAQGDQLDLSRLLQDFLPGEASRYLRRTVDDQGHVALQVDVHGQSDFAAPALVISLAHVLEADAITVLTGNGTLVL